MSFRWDRHWPYVAGISTAAFLLGGAAFNDEVGLFGSIVAAWVQALGSLAAIFFAWSAAKRQSDEEHRRLRALQISEITSNRTAGIAIVLMAAERLHQMADTLEEPSTREVAVLAARGAIQAAATTFGAFPIHLMGDPRGIIQISHIGGTLDIAQQMLAALEGSFKDAAEHQNAIDAAAVNLRGFGEHLDDKAKKLIEYYGIQAPFDGYQAELAG
ncbi:hypothetical protein [Phenylobacterium sp.]|uniref:hypothetical protein n=1 Tax=Phenylobacterium sp. TaxID=1871053 RepID=UPI003001F786